MAGAITFTLGCVLKIELRRRGEVLNRSIAQKHTLVCKNVKLVLVTCKVTDPKLLSQILYILYK